MEVITQSKTVTFKSMFLPYQVDRIMDPSRFILDEKVRRIGLTFAYGYKYTFKRAKTAGKTWYTANDSSTVLEFIDYISYFAKFLNSAFEVIDENMIVDEGEILTKVVRFKNGSKIIGLSSNPTALHGKGGDVILDEFAYHKQAQTMWEAAQATAGWGDDLVMLSTHTSDDSAFNLHIKNAKRLYGKAMELGVAPGSDAMRKLGLELGLVPWSYRSTTIHKAVEQGLVEKINATKGTTYTREDFLKECRAKCQTENQWKRQYCCEPSSDASALLNYNLILSCVADNCLKPISSCSNAYQGMDFARRHDLSVIANGEKLGDVSWLRELHRLSKMKFRDQLAIARLALNHPHFQRGEYDQGGMGEMPVEELKIEFGEYKITGVIYTNAIKANLALNLFYSFQDKRVRIPNDQKLFDALNKIKKSTSTTGKIIFDSESDEDGHSDEFWALAMMNDAAMTRTTNFFATLI